MKSGPSQHRTTALIINYAIDIGLVWLMKCPVFRKLNRRENRSTLNPNR